MRLNLKGDCRFLPSQPIVSKFICVRNGETYTVSFTDLDENENAQNKFFISPETAQKWQVTVTKQVAEKVNELIHLSEMGFTNDNSIHFHQYSLCDETICVSFNSESISTYGDIVLQLTPILIEAENESAL